MTVTEEQPTLFEDSASWTLARTGGTANEILAAERVAPTTGTRKANVLAYLRARPGRWVAGHVITAPSIGGAEGKRRARELRAAGWPIECRPDPQSATDWEYRYVPEEVD